MSRDARRKQKVLRDPLGRERGATLPGPRAGARERGWLVLICCALALMTAAVYGQMGRHEFIHFDDNEYIYENPHVSSGLSAQNLAWAFTAYHSNNWHPTTWLSHMLDCQLFGLRPGPHHLVSALLHALNGILLFLLLRRMTGALWRSAVVAALFTLHPMHVESVAWAAERKDVLSTCFALLTLWAYAAYAKRPGLARYLPVLLLFAAGIMAKPMLVTLPFAMLLLDYWPLRRFGPGGAAAQGPGRRFRAALLTEKLPLLALVAVSSVLTLVAQTRGGVVRSLEELSPALRATNALVSFVRYAVKLLLPVTQAFYYPYPKELPLAQAAGAGVVLVVVTVAFWRLRRTRPYALVGWLWFLGTLVPVIGLVQVATQAVADRYSYIPSVGLFIVVVWGLADLARRWPRGRIILGVAAGVALFALGAKAADQTRYWRDGVTLFSRDIQVVKENPMGYRNLGVELCDRGRYAEAIPMFREVLKTYPHDAVSLFDIASACEKTGDLQEALRSYRESLQSDPNRADAHYNLGGVLKRLGRPQEAVVEFEAAIRLKPEFAAAYNNLGNALSQLGRDSLAIVNYQESIRRNPSYAEAHNNLGSTYRKLGRGQAALEQFDTALRLDPNLAAAEFNRAIVYLASGDSARAKRHFGAAVRLNPELGAAVPPSLRVAPPTPPTTRPTAP